MGWASIRPDGTAMTPDIERELRAYARKECSDAAFGEQFLRIARAHEHWARRARERSQIGLKRVKEFLETLAQSSPHLQALDFKNILLSRLRPLDENGEPEPDGLDLQREAAVFVDALIRDLVAAGVTTIDAAALARRARDLVGEDARGRPNEQFRLGTFHQLNALFLHFQIKLGSDGKPKRIKVARAVVAIATRVEGDQGLEASAIVRMVQREAKETPPG